MTKLIELAPSLLASLAAGAPQTATTPANDSDRESQEIGEELVKVL